MHNCTDILVGAVNARNIDCFGLLELDEPRPIWISNVVCIFYNRNMLDVSIGPFFSITQTIATCSLFGPLVSIAVAFWQRRKMDPCEDWEVTERCMVWIPYISIHSWCVYCDGIRRTPCGKDSKNGILFHVYCDITSLHISYRKH
jgi:hypothetical protein